MLLRFLPPNMAALFGPAIGARTSRHDELGYIAHRAPAQRNTIKSFSVSISLILLYHLSDGSPTGPIRSSPTAGTNQKLPKTHMSTHHTQKHLRQVPQTAPMSAAPQTLVPAPKQSPQICTTLDPATLLAGPSQQIPKKQTSNYNTQKYVQQEPQTPSTDTVHSLYLVFPPKQLF
jgi:hypothetical protein